MKKKSCKHKTGPKGVKGRTGRTFQDRSYRTKKK